MISVPSFLTKALMGSMYASCGSTRIVVWISMLECFATPARRRRAVVARMNHRIASASDSVIDGPWASKFFVEWSSASSSETMRIMSCG